MKTIEINSSFNVIIKFSLASLTDRGVAFLIDIIVIWVTIGIITLFLALIAPNSSEFLFLYAAVPVWGFYSLLFETMNNGQTLGKMAMKIQVVRLDGQRTRMSDYVIRWIFKPLDLYLTSFILGILTVTASPKGQRLGDILADTTVIKIKESTKSSLGLLMGLEHLNNETVNYPQIIKLSEDDMMVIKESIDTYKKYTNEGHKKAIETLVIKVEEILGVECRGDHIQFLQGLIKDYVILTR